MHSEYGKRLAAANAALNEANAKVQRLEAKLAVAVAKRKAGADCRPLGTRERETLRLIALLGAVKGYGYDPDRRTPAAKLLEADTEALGAKVSDDTIRDHLRAAANDLRPDWRARLKLKPNSDKA